MASRTGKQNRKAGHRSWAARNARVAGVHKGDFMSPETRSRVMARIKGKDTSPERIICIAIEAFSIAFEKHAVDLPGRPDMVFPAAKLAVFIDGDFWHGWRFPLWEHKLSEKWRSKIAATRKRDQRNFRKLRKLGWKVLRIWEHCVETNPLNCVHRILVALDDGFDAMTDERSPSAISELSVKWKQRAASQAGTQRFRRA